MASRIKWARVTVLTIAVVFSLGIAVAGGLGFGFFFFPLFFLIGGVYLLYRALARVDVRNPLAGRHATISERWADGQPLDRARAGEEECTLCAEEDHRFHADAEATQRRIDEEVRIEDETHRPEDYQGPPPVVPFP